MLWLLGTLAERVIRQAGLPPWDERCAVARHLPISFINPANHVFEEQEVPQERMERMYQLIIALTNFFYRQSGGRLGGKMNGGDVLLLTTTGRKTGKQRTRPLIYFRKNQEYVIAASAGGASSNPGWFFNLRSNPHAVIQVKDKRIPVLAEVADPEEKRALWTQLVASLPFYEQYQRKTKREIPMVILHPAGNA